MFTKYYKENKKAVLILVYLGSILFGFLMVLFSSLTKEDYEIKNLGTPVIYNFINYEIFVAFLIILHLGVCFYLFNKNKIVSVIFGFIALFFMFIILYPLIGQL